MYSYSEVQVPHMSPCSCTLYSELVMMSLVMANPIHVQLLRSPGSPHVPIQLHCVLLTSYNESGYDESHTATKKPRFPTYPCTAVPHTAVLCTPDWL